MKTRTEPKLLEVADLSMLLAGAMDATHVRMTDAVTILKAAAYDREPGDAEAWCFTHGRSVQSCTAHELGCKGVPSAHGSDPTGSAAVDKVWDDARDLEADAEVAHAALKRMLSIVQRYQRHGDYDPTAPTASRDLEELNRPKCQVHLRHGWLADSRSAKPSQVKHKGQTILDVPYRLCRWCEDQVRERYSDTGQRRLPSEREVDRHARRVGLQQTQGVQEGAA